MSTDDSEFAKFATSAGAEAPFLRPATLATDEAPMLDVALHALDWYATHKGWEPTVLCLLQPTSPLRTASDLQAAAALLEGTDAVVGVVQVKHHPAWLQRLAPDGELIRYAVDGADNRRQDLEPVYALNGALYFVRTNALREHRTFRPPQTRGYVMPPERSVDIDSEMDWKIAELLAAEAANVKGKSQP